MNEKTAYNESEDNLSQEFWQIVQKFITDSQMEQFI